MSHPLQGRRAVVTGAASGLGAAAVRALFDARDAASVEAMFDTAVAATGGVDGGLAMLGG